MTVERNANFIGDLNESYPAQRDLIHEGDDHIRLLKAVLKKTFPGIDKAVDFTSEKLNQLNETLVYGEEGLLNINNSIELKAGVTANMGGAVLTNVGDPKDALDAVNLQSLQGKLMWPIGSIYMTIDARDPNEIFGFGKWAKFAEGRVIIGSGASTDTANNSKIIQNESQGGQWLHQMTADQIPSHTHTVGNATVKEAGEHRHGLPSGGGSDGGRVALAIDEDPNTGNHAWGFDWEDGWPATLKKGAHTHELEFDIQPFGGTEKIPMDQPWMACNIWKRTE